MLPSIEKTMGHKKYQNWQTKAGLLKLIQDMPIRYVHLMPFARIAVHRGKLPHQAVPCIFCRWMICAVRIPITNPFLAPFLSTIFLAVPPHHAFTSRLCWWMKLVVYLPIWNKRLLPHALTIHSVSLCDPAFMHSVALSIFKSLTLNGHAGKEARLRGGTPTAFTSRPRSRKSKKQQRVSRYERFITSQKNL